VQLPVTPGSHADLLQTMASGNQAPYLEWLRRNVELCLEVERGEVACCGAWKQPGYDGWCELLTKPCIAVKRRGEVVKLFKCPKADSEEKIGEWFVGLLDELDDLCKGDSSWLLS